MKQTKAITVEDIKPYYTEKSMVNGFGFYHYLHIRGGSGIPPWRSKKHRYGGEYKYILFYAAPDEMECCDKCERIWCEEKGIIYGEGNTILESYQDYLNKKDGKNG